MKRLPHISLVWLVAGVAAVLCSGCGTSRTAISTPARRIITLPVYKGLAYRHGFGLRPQVLVPISYIALPDPRLPRHKQGSNYRPLYVSTQGTDYSQPNAVVDRRALDQQRVRMGAARENETLTSKADYSTGAFDTDRYYDNLMAMYQADSNDSKGMREFKALKDTLDNVMIKSGYTQKEIKQFYILNYLGAEQANQKRRSRQGSSHRVVRPEPTVWGLWWRFLRRQG